MDSYMYTASTGREVAGYHQRRAVVASDRRHEDATALACSRDREDRDRRLSHSVGFADGQNALVGLSGEEHRDAYHDTQSGGDRHVDSANVTNTSNEKVERAKVFLAELLDLMMSVDIGLLSPLDIFQPIIMKMAERAQLISLELDAAERQVREQSIRETTLQSELQTAHKENKQLKAELKASRVTIEHLHEELEGRNAESARLAEMVVMSDQQLRMHFTHMLQQFQSQVSVQETQVWEQAGSQRRLKESETPETGVASSRMLLSVSNGSDRRQMQEATKSHTSEMVKPKGHLQVMGYRDGINRSFVGGGSVHVATADLSKGTESHKYETHAAGQPQQGKPVESAEKQTLPVFKSDEKQPLSRVGDLEDENDQLRQRVVKLEQKVLYLQNELEMSQEKEAALWNENCHLRRKARHMSEHIDKAGAVYREQYQKADKTVIGRDVTTDSGMEPTPQSMIEDRWK